MKFKNTKNWHYLMIFCLILSANLNTATRTKALSILGLSGQPSAAQIKQAYRKGALKNHPDKNPEGLKTFQKLAKAYEALTDPEFEFEPEPDYFEGSDASTAPFQPEKTIPRAAPTQIAPKRALLPEKVFVPAPARSTRATSTHRTYAIASDIVRIFIDGRQYILIGSNGKVYYPATVLDENGIRIPAMPRDHANKPESFRPLELNPYEKHAVLVLLLRSGVLYQEILSNLKIVVKGLTIKDQSHPEFQKTIKALNAALSEVLGHYIEKAYRVDEAAEEICNGEESSFSKKHPSFELDLRKRLQQLKNLLIKQKRNADFAGNQGYTSKMLQEKINRIDEYLSA